MDFRSSISAARSSAWSAVSQLDRYDRSGSPDSAHNRAVLDAASSYISPGATRHGADALDAARWERWVTIRQIRDVGSALQLLDRAWWGIRPGGSDMAPDIDGARSALREAISYLDRSSHRWATSPLVATNPLVASDAA